MLSNCYTTQRTNIFREPLVRLLRPLGDGQRRKIALGFSLSFLSPSSFPPSAVPCIVNGRVTFEQVLGTRRSNLANPN